ncbi:BnaA02g04110D, partial [Brassica napus]
MHPHFFNNLKIPQQFHQFGLPNHINQLLPNLLGNLLGGHSLPPLVHPTFFQPSLHDPFAFTSQPQGNSFNSLPYLPVPTPHQNHQMHPPGFLEPRPQVQSVGNVNNTNVTSNSKVNDFGNKYTKQQKFKGTGQGFQKSQLHQADNPKKKFGFNKDQIGIGNKKKIATGLDESDTGNIAMEKNRRPYVWKYTPKEIQQWQGARRKNYPTKLNVEKLFAECKGKC